MLNSFTIRGRQFVLRLRYFKNYSSIKHNLARSCFQFWPKICDEGDKIWRKKTGKALESIMQMINCLFDKQETQFPHLMEFLHLDEVPKGAVSLIKVLLCLARTHSHLDTNRRSSGALMLASISSNRAKNNIITLLCQEEK